jgi:L-seryl-tRNA(Ser) seleniumtransferase
MAQDIFAKYQLRRVINCSGTETPYGGSPVRPEVVEAIASLVPHSVFMSELQLAASRAIVRATGSESGCVTGCTAASITISVAATMTGIDLALVEQLPDTTGMRNEVVMLRGHAVSYAHHVEQNVRLAGARVVEVGAATDAGLYQLRHALSDRAAAALYVISPLAVSQRMPDLASFVKVCHERAVPVIVDAAAVADPRPFIATGADLVLWSAHKAMGSVTGGFVAGSQSLVRACLLQEHGIGRPMKVGKEGVVGALAALEAWAARDVEKEDSALSARIGRVVARLGALPGVFAEPAGRQVGISVDAGKAGASAGAVAACLAAGDPAILLWAHHAREGKLLMSLAKVTDDVADLVCERIEAALRGEASAHQGNPETYADQMKGRLLDWTGRI